MIKITGGQRIDLLGVAKEDLPAVWKELGMPSGYAYGKTFRTVKTCVGSEFCRFGLGDSTTLGIRLEERYKGLESPAKLKLGVAGCPRNCSEAMVKDVGFVAVEGERWEMYVGGAAGAHVRKGDLLCTLDTRRRGDAARRPLHAVLPRAREMARADLPLHGARRASTRCARSSSTTATARPRGWTPRSRPRSTPTATRGSRPTSPPRRRSSPPSVGTAP